MLGQPALPQPGVEVVQEPFLLLAWPDRLVLLVVAEEEPYADIETHARHRSLPASRRSGQRGWQRGAGVVDRRRPTAGGSVVSLDEGDATCPRRGPGRPAA